MALKKNLTHCGLRFGTCLLGLLFITNQLFAEPAVPHTFTAGQPAKAADVNENFLDLSSRIEAISKPERSYSVLSTETLENGLIRTKLYAYELSDYSGHTRLDPSNPDLYLNEGNEHVVNALGEFRGEWSYISNFTETNSAVDQTNTSPIPCHDGSAMERLNYDVAYNVTWRNERGVLAFSNRGTANAGLFRCTASTFTSDNGTSYSLLEYYYLEGIGAGTFSCIDKAVLHGAFFEEPNAFWDRAYVPSQTVYPNAVVGVFDRMNNGLWGTYYLEIDAPAGCLDL